MYSCYKTTKSRYVDTFSLKLDEDETTVKRSNVEFVTMFSKSIYKLTATALLLFVIVYSSIVTMTTFRTRLIRTCLFIKKYYRRKVVNPIIKNISKHEGYRAVSTLSQ